jgi:hypothetical protein
LPDYLYSFNLLKLPAYGSHALLQQGVKLALAYGKDMQMA